MRRILAASIVVMLASLDAHAQAPSAAEQELIKLENTWSLAWQKKDVATLDLLFAAEYMSTDMEGKTWSKAQELANAKDPSTSMTSFKLANLKVHIYNDAFAVVTGSNTSKSTFKGKDTSGSYVFTDVFVKRDGRWQCVATQATLAK